MRRILFNKTYNTRDLGSIPISLYQKTKSHQFIRSDALLSLNDEEINYLINYGVKVIVDLRNNDEIRKKPNCLQNHPCFTYFHLPFLNDDSMQEENKYAKDGGLSKKDLLGIYHDIIDNYQVQIKEFFLIIENHINDGILFHCSAGKDRTGILTMFLLSIAGVNKLDIIADYEISFTYLLPRLEMLRKEHGELPMHIMESKREFMMDIMNYIEKNYGDIINYLLKIGINQHLINLIKTKIVT